MIQRIVAGAIFDFAGFLTTLQEPITLGHREETCARTVKLIEEWAASRGLKLDNADVGGWQRELD